jgi:hypothetical protein
MSNKNGTLTLESTLIFPLIIIIIFAFSSKISIYRVEMLIKSIVIKENEKASLYGILYEYAELSYEFLTENDMDQMTGDFLFVNLYEVLFSRSFDQQYSSTIYRQRILGANLENIQFYVEKNLFDSHLILTAKYSIRTPFGLSHKMFSLPVCIWYRGDGSGRVLMDQETSVWNLDNLKRGEYLRKRFGGNLPGGFPVLSGFWQNEALLIKSMDLNKKTWQDPEAVQRKLHLEIMALYEYSGNTTPWGKDGILIAESDIHRRIIRFIFPENIDRNLFMSMLNQTVFYGNALGIEVDIIFFQKSIPPE